MAKQSSAAASRRGTTRPAVRTTSRRTIHEEPTVRWGIPLTKMNFFVILGGVALIVIGYLLMSTSIYSGDPANNDGVWNNANAVSIAPIVLTIGYLVVIPFGLFYRFKKDEPENGNTVA